MDGPLFSGLVCCSVVLVLGALIFLARAERPLEGPGRLVFRYHIGLRILTLVLFFGTILMVTIILFFNPPKQDGDVYAIFGVYALFTGLGLPLFWETHFFLLEVDDDGLTCHSPWRGKFFIAWGEVDEVAWADFGSYFLVKGPQRWIRLSPMVGGLAEFLKECEKRLPSEKVDGARRGYSRVGLSPPGRRLDRPLPRQEDVLRKWAEERRPRRPEDY